MPSANYDLRYLESGIEILETYLLSDSLYWQTGASAPPGEPQLPSLTLGGLLLARQRLAARQAAGSLDLMQQQQFAKLPQALENARSHWRTAWEHKAQRSFYARLTQWRNYLMDHQAQPETYAAQYPQEARIRVMISLLEPEVGQIEPQALEMLDQLDSLLRTVLQPGAFVWDADLALEFQQPQYWYLYGKLAE